MLDSGDVWSNSSRCRQESVYYSWTWCLYNDHFLDIGMIIWRSINCPTVICSPTVCYFSREKPLVKPTAPGSLSHKFAFAIYFSLAFILKSIKPKIQKYLAAFYSYLFYLAFDLSIYYNFISRLFAILRRRTRKGLTTPLTHQVASICYLCAGVVYVVWGGSPTSSITLVSSLREIPTISILHHPFLFGEIPT